MQTIVKRKGHQEKYDSHKVYASVYAACLSVHVHQGEAELIAEKVTLEVGNWIKKRLRVTSQEISAKVITSLELLNPEAAFMYRTHKDIS